MKLAGEVASVLSDLEQGCDEDLYLYRPKTRAADTNPQPAIAIAAAAQSASLGVQQKTSKHVG
ncbi:MAG: hypothetical protein WKG52_12335 [Variovorax sp.]